MTDLDAALSDAALADTPAVREMGRPAPIAWCPLCELPRAQLYTITFLGVPTTFSSCVCVTRGMTVLPDGVRSIPMTENHDPGDED